MNCKTSNIKTRIITFNDIFTWKDGAIAVKKNVEILIKSLKKR